MPVQSQPTRVQRAASKIKSDPSKASSPKILHKISPKIAGRRRAIDQLPVSPSLVPQDAPAAMDLMENYRAQIAHCDRLKSEMDSIQSAIFQTKREIAGMNQTGFEGRDAIDVHGELSAIVGGTEQATQTILAAAEAIETARSAMASVETAEQRTLLSAEIGDNVVAIFEACNFQDLTGQRIGKVMATMGAIETHIGAMMEIWGGVAAIKACAPEAAPERDADARLLNGPKLHESEEYVSQNAIDAMFD